MESDDLQRRRWHTLRFILISGWVAGMLAICGVLVATLAVWLLGRPVPDPLLNMAMLAMGFFTGSLPSMVKETLRDG